MIGGSLIVGICLLALGWASEIVGFWVKDPNTVWFHGYGSCMKEDYSDLL